MSLMCSCDNDEWEPGMVIWFDPSDYAPLTTKRDRKCCSCGSRIAVSDECSEVKRGKVPEHEIEVRIYGEDDETVPLASKWLCETCAGLAFALDDLGYCAQPWEDQRELVKEYAELHAPNAALTGSEAVRVEGTVRGGNPRKD